MVPTSTLRRTLALASVALLASLPAAAGAAAPADPLFDGQWALQSGEPLDVSAAWKIADGAGTVVAVVDSGTDMSHPDLRGALWTNPGEVAGNGKDDDRDGFVDDVHGVDLVDRDGDPSDEDGHGTHVAGIVAAARNSVGGVGVAPGAKVMSIRVLDSVNVGTTANVATGVRYAIAHHATVINMSVNGDIPDDDLRAAIAEADAAGIAVVVSAGNNGRDLGLKPSYPASFSGSDLLSVAAADITGVLANFSNFGKLVSLSAPGVSILSTARGGGYELRSGTSMAAPETAAALALLKSVRPDFSPAQLRSTLLGSARRMPGLAGVLGAGELDIVAALKSVAPASRTVKPLLTARIKRRARNKSRSLVTWSLGDSSGVVSRFRISGKGGLTITRKPAESRGAWVSLRRGRVRISALDAAGQEIAAATVRLR